MDKYGVLHQLESNDQYVRAGAVSLSLEMSQIVLHYVQVLHVSSRLSSPQLCGSAGLHLSSVAVTDLDRTHTRPFGPGPNTDP